MHKTINKQTNERNNRPGRRIHSTAEDSMVQSKKLQYFLKEEHGIKHVICKNGEEAFNQALIEKPTLIISAIL